MALVLLWATALVAGAQQSAVQPGAVTFRFVPDPREKVFEVKLAGTMNGWSLTDPAYVMTRQPDGSFTLRTELAPGRHYFKFVVDGKWAKDMKNLAGRFEPSHAAFDGSGLGSARLDVAAGGAPADTPPPLSAPEARTKTDVANLAARSEAGTAVLSWSLADRRDVARLEVLAHTHYETLYDPTWTVVATLAPDATSAEVPLEPLADVSLEVRTVSREGVPSEGRVARVRVAHPCVVLDRFEERNLLVRLPEGYEEAEGRFPVVYMHDGQNLFSKATGAGAEWEVDETLDRLEREGRIEKTVVVGIFASGARAEEYLPYRIPNHLGGKEFEGRGAEYAKWVAERVVPYVESKYKVSRERRGRGVMGSSYGGVLALWTILHQPEVFSFGGVLSPAPVVGLYDDVVSAAKADTKIWLDAGELETYEGTSYVDTTRMIVDALGRKGWRYGDDLLYYEVPGATTHAEEVVARRVAYPFLYFRGKPPKEAPSVELVAGRPPTKTAPGAVFVNAVADFPNGIRYSLLGLATYEVASSGRATVSPHGVLSLNGDASAEVAVSHGGGQWRTTVAAVGPFPGGDVSAGTLIRHAAFPSKHVTPRSVDVWLPPGYFESPKERYPVLYMHDGQNLFDASISYAGEWGVDEALAKLVASGDARPAIVVGVWNTSRRFPDYMPRKAFDLASEEQRTNYRKTFGDGPESDGYLRFLVEELKPFVDRTYRTRTDRDDTMVMGSSMGGLISLYAICEYPSVFGRAACVSTHWPAVGGAVVDYMRGKLPDPATHRIYFDFGTEGLDAQYEPYQLRADEIVRAAGYVDGRNWTTRKFTGEDHNETSWRKRAHIPLTFLLGR
jgi:predicted alpha/beta superfamily hydrolase